MPPLLSFTRYDYCTAKIYLIAIGGRFLEREWENKPKSFLLN
jgi:hypothetical protein